MKLKKRAFARPRHRVHSEILPYEYTVEKAFIFPTEPKQHTKGQSHYSSFHGNKKGFQAQLKTSPAAVCRALSQPLALVWHSPPTPWRVRRKQSRAMSATFMGCHGDCCQRTWLLVAFNLKDFSGNACAEGDLLNSKSLPAAGRVADGRKGPRAATKGETAASAGGEVKLQMNVGPTGSGWGRGL